jgi:hypothetical protein
MRNRLVPRAEWFQFFTDFSHRHEGALATVRVLHPRLGSQIEARDLPLEGLVSSARANGPISVHLGDSADRHLEHEIEDPRQIWVEMSEEGGEEAVAVISEDGTRTIVEFAAPRRASEHLRIPVT